MSRSSSNTLFEKGKYYNYYHIRLLYITSTIVLINENKPQVSWVPVQNPLSLMSKLGNQSSAKCICALASLSDMWTCLETPEDQFIQSTIEWWSNFINNGNTVKLHIPHSTERINSLRWPFSSPFKLFLILLWSCTVFSNHVESSVFFCCFTSNEHN